MEQIFAENWALMHYGLILSLTCAQMLVVYSLSDSTSPPAGLGMFTVYFMAALVGWIAFTLQRGYQLQLGLDVPTVAAIINSYILVLAMGLRSGVTYGRNLLGLLCLTSCLSVFFLNPGQLFVVHALTVAFFFLVVGLLAGWRAFRLANVGDAIIGFAAALAVVVMSLAVRVHLDSERQDLAEAMVFAAHSISYALLVIGFLASVVIEYQQGLSHLATEDPLTRLLNRRGLEDALRVSLASAERHESPTAAIMVDIDHFKRVNDSFGHDTGDHVLQQVAVALKRLSRGSDVVARIGGEEFLLVLPNTDMASARILAERIRQAVADNPVAAGGQQIAITISLGVACSRGLVPLDNLIDEADRAMYVAKQGGRNRVASVEHRSVQLRSERA